MSLIEESLIKQLPYYYNYNLLDPTYQYDLIKSIRSRAEVGLKKYGVTLERDDLTEDDWIQHALEESQDLCGYLEKLSTFNPPYFIKDLQNTAINLMCSLKLLQQQHKNLSNNG